MSLKILKHYGLISGLSRDHWAMLCSRFAPKMPKSKPDGCAIAFFVISRGAITQKRRLLSAIVSELIVTLSDC